MSQRRAWMEDPESCCRWARSWTKSWNSLELPNVASYRRESGSALELWGQMESIFAGGGLPSTHRMSGSVKACSTHQLTAFRGRFQSNWTWSEEDSGPPPAAMLQHLGMEDSMLKYQLQSKVVVAGAPLTTPVQGLSWCGAQVGQIALRPAL